MARKVSGTQLRRIIREEKARVRSEMLAEKSGFDFDKFMKVAKQGAKGAKQFRDFSQSDIGREVTGKGLDYAEKKAGEKGYGEEAKLARGVAGAAGVGGAVVVGDAEMPKSKMRVLARQAKYGKKGLKTPTGMPIGDIEIKDDDGKKVYAFMDTDGEDIETYRDRGDAVYVLVDEATAKNDPTLSECRIRLKVRHQLKKQVLR